MACSGPGRRGARCRCARWGPFLPPSPLPQKVCHHAECQQLHRRGPLNLCEACDSKFHSIMHYDGHVRFDLPPQGERGEGPQPVPSSSQSSSKLPV